MVHISDIKNVMLKTVMLMILVAVAVSCSTTSNLPEGEVLYTGIKKTTINKPDSVKVSDAALTEVEAALAYAPNNSFMGSSSLRFPLPIGLWVYNAMVNHSHKGFGKWVFNTFARQPVTISAVNPPTRTKVATNILQNYGYFQGTVDYELVQQRNPRKQKISYTVTPGRAYFLDSIRYDFPDYQDSIVSRFPRLRQLKKGEQFSVYNLESERSRLSEQLRNSGYYYYRPEYISYFADTVQAPGKVQLLVTPSKDMPAYASRRWSIGSIGVRMRRNVMDKLTDTVSVGGVLMEHSGERMPVAPRILFRNMYIRPGDMFSQRKADATTTNLSNLGIFSNVQFDYVPRDTTDTCTVLDVMLNTTLDKLIDAEVDFNITQKSNSQVGPNLALLFSKRNAFRHGETASIRLKGSYEWQTSKSVQGKSSKINSYEYGIEASLSYPWLAFPGLASRMYRYPASTSFKISADHLNRAGYYRLLSFSANASYTFKTSRTLTHTFSPLELTFNKMQSTTAKFDSITSANEALYISLRDQFIPAVKYSITYDNTSMRRKRITTWFEASVKESANLIAGISALAGSDFNREGKKLLGNPYSQFTKVTLELRNNFKFTQKSSIATRFYLGTVFTYGNSSVAPYSEQFYAGGANSIRAFAVRSIGPGGYRDADGRGTYLDQSGDFRLELNAEYRFCITGNLYGALFVDAGNVWNLKKDDSHPKGEITLSRMFDEIALGTGAGLRYDMEFLVLRLDLGVALHAPYDTGKSGYYNIPRFKDGIAWHFAVGYPF